LYIPPQTPKQSLDDDEFIRVRRVPLQDLEQLLAAGASEGLVPFCGLQMFVAGVVLGMGMGSTSE